MANRWFPKYKENLIEGDAPALDSSTLKAYLVRGYTYSASHEFLSDVTGAGGTIVAISAALGSKTTAAGIFDAADTQFDNVTAGAACDVVLIVEDSGSSATSDLVVYIDTATNLPVTPNGGDIPIAWDSGANKIGAL